MNIAITGLGIICAIGNDCQQVLDSLVNKKTGVGMMKNLQSCHKELPVGEVKLSDDELKTLLGLPVESLYSRTTLLGAVAVKQAMADAGLSADMLAGKKVVLISGTTVGGMDVTERILTDMRDSLKTPYTQQPSPVDYVKRHDCGSTTNEIAQICGLDCEVCTISTACSSAINSIIVGCEMLRCGEADIVIAGGSEALSKFHLNGFNTLHILDTEVCRPFDATRVGLTLVKVRVSLFFRRIKPMARRILEDMETSAMPFIRQLLLMMVKVLILQCVRPWNLLALINHR